MKAIISGLVLLLSLVNPTLACAMDELEVGLRAGDVIPQTFRATSHLGEEVEYKDIRGEKGLILLFNRSAQWCPHCQKQMKDWSEHVKRFEDQGYKVAAITYDSVEKLKAFHEKNAIAYTLLSDEGSKMIELFGILNVDVDRESRAYGVPYPAIYVINPAGIISHRFTLEGYKKRPAVDVVYDAVFGKTMPVAGAAE